MSAELTANGRSLVTPALLWVSKTALLWLALLLAAVVAGKLVPVNMPLPPQDGPLTMMQAFLVVNGLAALALSLVAAIARVRGLALGAVLFVAYFAIGSAMMQIETLYFNESVKMPLAAVGQLVTQAAVIGAIVAVTGMLLFHPVPENSGPLPAHLARRIVLMAVVYVVLYYAAGFFIAWQSAAVRAYYSNGIHISLPLTVVFQIFRGTLWALISLYILSRMKGSIAARALVMAVLFAALTAAQLLYPNPLLPWEVRQAHLVEVATSEFAYGIIVTFVLLSGAARRPLADSSHWRLIAGNA